MEINAYTEKDRDALRYASDVLAMSRCEMRTYPDRFSLDVEVAAERIRYLERVIDAIGEALALSAPK